MPIQKQPTGAFSSYYGCLIMIAAILVFGGILGWTAFTMFSQNRTFAELAQDQPADLGHTPLSASDQSILDEKLATFAKATTSGTEASLPLNLAELNALLAMAPDTGNGSYSDLVRFTGTDVTAQTLVANVSLPIRKLPWEDGFRYLVGTASFTFSDTPDGIEANLSQLTIPGKTPPDGFEEAMAFWSWVAPYRKTDPLGPVLHSIHSIQITPTGLTVSTSAP